MGAGFYSVYTLIVAVFLCWYEGDLVGYLLFADKAFAHCSEIPPWTWCATIHEIDNGEKYIDYAGVVPGTCFATQGGVEIKGIATEQLFWRMNPDQMQIGGHRLADIGQVCQLTYAIALYLAGIHGLW